MYLDYKHDDRYNGLKGICIVLFLCLVMPKEGNSQNVSSPYSILGIGDVDTKDFGRYFASGNASVARRDAASYNFSNPASLTALPFKTMNFDISTRGRTSSFESPGIDTVTGISKDFIVKRATIAFKVSNKSAFAFGLRPFSSVNYQYNTDKVILDGSSSYTKYVTGDGGVNQVYFSYAHSFGKHVSVGATASYLFGSINRETFYEGSNINLLLLKKDNTFFTGANIQGGIQYYTKPGKWQHTIGLTASAGSNLRGQNTLLYIEDIDSIKTEAEDKQNFKMPLTTGLAYTATLNNKFTVSLEANYHNWEYQKLALNRTYTNPSTRLSIGMEYSKKIKFLERASNTPSLIEKWYLGWGASMENSYVKIKGQDLWDYSFSVGGGYNIFNGVSLYSGLEIGKKGNLNKGQIRENYTQFIFGFTLKNIWIGPKYTKRYD